MNLVWGNRYAMTMYEKRPTRWRDVPRHRDDVFLPLLTPWEQGERKVAAVDDGVERPPPDLGRRGRGPDLREPVRHLPPQAPPRDRAPAHQADRGGDHERSRGTSPSASRATTRTTRPTATRRSSTATRRSPELEPLHRLAMVLHNQYPWDLAAVAARGGRQDRRRRLRRRVRAAQPRGARVHPARARPSVPPRPRPAPPAEARAPVEPLPPDGRARAVRAHAAPRVAGGRQGRARLHERGHHPQRGLQLVADDRRRHRGQDGDPRAALHRAPARAHLAAGGPRGARGRRAPAGGDRRGHLLLVHEHDADPVRRDLALRAARDLPDARLVRPRSPPARASPTASPRRCGSSRRSSGRCSSSAPRSSRTRSAPSARRG